VSDRPTFTVICRHCEVTVLTVPIIADADQERLAEHLRTVHPTVYFYTPKLSRLLDHFIVQRSSRVP
jgi:hypothetical protein